MSTAQIVFSIALAVVGAIIVFFAIYVLNTTMWGNRWVRPPKKRTDSESEKEVA